MEGILKIPLRIAASIVVTTLIGLVIIPNTTTAGPPRDAEFVGSETCAGCHEDVAEAFPQTGQ